MYTELKAEARFADRVHRLARPRPGALPSDPAQLSRLMYLRANSTET